MAVNEARAGTRRKSSILKVLLSAVLVNPVKPKVLKVPGKMVLSMVETTSVASLERVTEKLKVPGVMVR